MTETAKEVGIRRVGGGEDDAAVGDHLVQRFDDAHLGWKCNRISKMRYRAGKRLCYVIFLVRFFHADYYKIDT